MFVDHLIHIGKMSSTLASLRSCVSEFNPDRSLDDEVGGENLEKKWAQWLENFEVCLDF